MAVAERIAQFPFAFARRHGLLVQAFSDDAVELLCREDVQPHALLEARRSLGRPLNITQVSSGDFESVLQQVYEGGADSAMSMVDGMEGSMDLDHVADTLPEPEDLLDTDDDAPIIRLINALLTQAIKENASDIHIEPFENRLAVRFRVDGVLREAMNSKNMVAPLVVSRIKVMARLDIAEKRVPQDGRISVRIAGRAVDVRVSTLPSSHGERVVMRLLDKQAGRLDLSHLGMAAPARAGMERLISKPHGIILVTGPTGSGKTTSLYAALQQLNDRKRNILTVEDPIEYDLDGVGQTQVNSKADMSFARGLRAILRQDPDVLMIGEIRDLETAQIAVQASLTGHLVLSTLHTNTAIGAVTRLRDMGVEPFLLSSSLVGLISQRLVRTLDPELRQAAAATPRECTALRADPANPPTVYHPGYSDTNKEGYRGRSGIYELIEIDEELRGMIHDGASEQQMENHVRSTGIASIYDDGIRRVLAGDTTIEEVTRAVSL